MASAETVEQQEALKAEVARLRAELNATEQRLAFATSSAKLAWWDWDIRTGMLTRFGAQPGFLGFAPHDTPMTAQSWYSRVHPDDLPTPGVPTPLQRGVSEWTEELRVRGDDGVFRWVRNRACVSGRDSEGKPTRVLGTTQDIHEERCTAEAGKRAEETMRRDAQSLAQLQDAVVCTDVNLRITAWNLAAERIFQWTREELIGRFAGSRLPAEAALSAERNLRTVVDEGECVSCEWEDYRKDGSRVWIDWRTQVVTDSQGKVVGTVSVGRDITERRFAELKRRDLELQLFHAQKMETMGLLAGGIAHDFNNILTVILMLAELGAGGMASSPEDAFKDIRKGGLRAKDLVRRILTFSRPSEPERRVIDVSEVVEEALEFVRNTLSPSIDLRVELMPSSSTTLGDANQIQHVLVNLVSNAAFAMPHGGTLTIRLREQQCRRSYRVATGELSPGAYLVIEVEDTGLGIQEQDVPKVFDAFFTTKPPGEGTGLGLPIVRGIAEEHGGAVDVTSVPGKGSLFSLFLPALSSDRSALSPESPSTQAPRGCGERVLVVDDEESIAILTRSALEGLGYSAVHTTSPEAFLREFESNAAAYDLIIVDHTMPRVTGLELAQRVRRAGHAQPIIIATGFSGRLSRPALERLNDTIVLEKPFDVAELASNMRRLLEARQSSHVA
ncbi:MAG: ATP-binding protein [Myxococcales bacterium]